jgi:hypothetical protein
MSNFGLPRILFVAHTLASSITDLPLAFNHLPPVFRPFHHACTPWGCIKHLIGPTRGSGYLQSRNFRTLCFTCYLVRPSGPVVAVSFSSHFRQFDHHSLPFSATAGVLDTIYPYRERFTISPCMLTDAATLRALSSSTVGVMRMAVVTRTIRSG